MKGAAGAKARQQAAIRPHLRDVAGNIIKKISRLLAHSLHTRKYFASAAGKWS